MLFTVTTTTQSLSDLLSAAQKTIARQRREEARSFKVLIQNLHATVSVYVEAGADAAVASGIKIPSDSYLALDDAKLQEVNLIADGSDNNNIRILFS